MRDHRDCAKRLTRARRLAETGPVAGGEHDDRNLPAPSQIPAAPSHAAAPGQRPAAQRRFRRGDLPRSGKRHHAEYNVGGTLRTRRSDADRRVGRPGHGPSQRSARRRRRRPRDRHRDRRARSRGHLRRSADPRAPERRDVVARRGPRAKCHGRLPGRLVLRRLRRGRDFGRRPPREPRAGARAGAEPEQAAAALRHLHASAAADRAGGEEQSGRSRARHDRGRQQSSPGTGSGVEPGTRFTRSRDRLRVAEAAQRGTLAIGARPVAGR